MSIRARWWLATLCWGGVMALMSLSSAGRVLRFFALIADRGERLGVGRGGFYGSLHFVGFLVFGALLARALRASAVELHGVALGVVALAFYAGLLEGLQHFVPQRTVDPLDLLANLCGGCLGAGAVWRLTRPGTPAPPV